MNDAAFKKIIREYWRRHGRHDLPWRHTHDPYRILVSEIMLQQTQVMRIIDKYSEFLGAFPTFRDLADAKTAQVVKVWQGLGYNRRALMLQKCARIVCDTYHGILPDEYAPLRALPGIGPYTAGALLAFAHNIPHPVIETNIRRVYIHHYFPKKRSVDDALILPVITRHVSHIRNARHWYYALMDFGTMLARTTENPNRRSVHYVKQSPFEGSLRQLRGRILRVLSRKGSMQQQKLASELDDTRTLQAIEALEKEGFLLTEDFLVRLSS